MLGMHPLAAIFGAQPDLTDRTSALTYVKYLTSNLDLAVMLCRPLSKEPMDMRTDKDKEADQAAWEEMRKRQEQNGEKVARSPRHPGGLYLATTNTKAVRKYLTAAFKERTEMEQQRDMLVLRHNVAVLSAGGNDADALMAELGDEAVEEVHQRYTAACDELADLETRNGSKINRRKAVLKRLVDRTPLSESDRREWDTLNAKLAAPPANLAVEVGRSNLVVVDCDTAESVSFFQRWAAEKSGNEAWLYTAPTVRSPGAFDKKTQTWNHRDGGHFYFRVPQTAEDETTRTYPPIPSDIATTLTIDDPDNAGVYFDIAVNNRYILIPPSVREEGPYAAVGPSHDIEDWLYYWITDYGVGRLAERQKRAGEKAKREGLSPEIVDEIETWYAETPWSALLAPLGWKPANMQDSCGCPIWSRPGGSSPKSATAHEPGCSQHPNSLDPPIHFWTTEPGAEISDMIDQVGVDGRSLSKLQLLAATTTGGNIREAMTEALGRDVAAPEYEVRALSPGFGVAVPVERATADQYAMPSASSASASPTPAPSPSPSPAPSAPTANGAEQSPWDAGDSAASSNDVWSAPARDSATGSPWDAGDSTTPDNDVWSAPAGDDAPATGTPQPGVGAGSGMDVIAAAFQGQQQSTASAQQQQPTTPAQQQNAAPGVFGTYDDAMRILGGITGDEDTGVAEGEAQDEAVSSLMDNDKPEVFQYKTGSATFKAPDVYSLDDMLKRREPVNYLIKNGAEGWVPEHGLTVIAGASNAGKSVVTLDMAATLAAEYNDPEKNDSPFHMWFRSRAKKRRVLYIAGEGIDGAIERVVAWEHYHEASVRKNMMFTEEAFKLDSPEPEWQKLGRAVSENNIDVVIIDTLAQALTGLEENSNDDMGQVVNWLIRFAEHHRVSIWLVHHTGKGEGPATPRGASALTGAVAAQIMVEKRPPETLSEETRERFRQEGITPIRVWSNKQKDAMIPDPMEMTIVPHELPHIPGRPLTDDFGQAIPRTTVLLGDGEGHLADPYGPQPVLETVSTPRGGRSDTSVLAERIVTLVSLYGAGPETKRQESRLTYANISRQTFNTHGGDYFSRTAFDADFDEAVTFAIRSGAIVADGSRLRPNVTIIARRDSEKTLAYMLDCINNASTDTFNSQSSPSGQGNGQDNGQTNADT